MQILKPEYRRNLPHLQPEGGMFFITFRLYGSLPIKIIQEIRSEYKSDIEKIKKRKLDDNLEKAEVYKLQKKWFGKYDRYLNDEYQNISWLKNPKVADTIKDTLHFRDNKDYELICYTIMPNHVHLIFHKVTKPVYGVMQSIKSYTATRSNKILLQNGKFWQRESFDHLVRDGDELDRIIRYVLNNPVMANLTDHWTNWKYSWCREEFVET